MDAVICFRYREKFGLTYEEYLNEDPEQFMINNLIINVQNEMETAEAKMAERKIK